MPDDIEPWSLPPSEDEDVQASRDATGQVFLRVNQEVYGQLSAVTDARRAMPRTRAGFISTRSVVPPEAHTTLSADGNYRLIALPIKFIVEGDHTNLNLDFVKEFTKTDWQAMFPNTDE